MTNLTYHYVYTDYDRGIYHVDLENPDSAELIKRLVPHIYKEKPIAVAEYGGNYFYLRDSEENRKLLDKCVVRSDQYYYDENVKW